MVGGLYAIQPNRSVVEKNDGTLEGTIVYRADRANLYAIPDIGDPHFDESAMEMYQRTRVYQGLDVVEVTGSFFGLTSKKTDPIITYSGGQNNEAIETHEDFENFAGTAAAPLNGAKFDPVTRQFLGFLLPSASTPSFRGTTHWITPSTLVSVSYWQDSVPTLKKRMSIVNSISGFTVPPDVKDFLLLDTPYRQVGSFYQVTEQYLGSGERGWNSLIYPD